MSTHAVMSATETAAMLLSLAQSELATPEGRDRVTAALCKTLSAVTAGRCAGVCPIPANDRAMTTAVTETREALEMATAHVDFLARRVTGYSQPA